MKHFDWRTLVSICIFLGVISLIGSIVAWFCPYRSYASPLLIVGVSLLVVGVVSFSKAKEERKHEAEVAKSTSVALKKCPICGTRFSLEYEYCPSCGVNLETAQNEKTKD